MTNEICLRNGLSYPGMDRANMSCLEEYSNPLLPESSSKIPTQCDSNELLAGRDYLKKLGKQDRHVTARNYSDRGASPGGYVNYLFNFDDPHATRGEQIARAAAMPAVILGALISSPFISFACGNGGTVENGEEDGGPSTNHPPVLDPIGNQLARVGELFELTLTGSDPDGDVLTFGAVGLPAGTNLDADTGQFNWTPTIAQIGSHEITFEVRDGDLAASETISIEVRGVNEILESRITNDAAGSGYPSLVWTGVEYGVSWKDGRDGSLTRPEIYFARINSKGNKIGQDVRLTNGASSWYSSLVWAGSEYGVSWWDSRDGSFEIYFTRIDALGNKIGQDVRITNDAAKSWYPSLVWAGSEYGVSWYDDRDGPRFEIYFTRIDALGNKIGQDVRITNDARNSGAPSLVWTGTEYGVSWHDSRDGNHEIYFARIDRSGNKIGQDVRVTNASSSSSHPSLVWAGSEYGVSWEDFRYGNWEIYFARIDASGNKIGQDVRITDDAAWSDTPSLVWAGSEYGVSWTDTRDGYPEIYFARINALGNKIGQDVRITHDAAWSITPSLVWTGMEYGVSWNDDRDGNAEIYFARIAGNFTPTL